MRAIGKTLSIRWKRSLPLVEIAENYQAANPSTGLLYHWSQFWTLLPKKVQMRDLVALDLNFAKDFGYVSGKQMLKTSGELFRQLKGLATLGRCGTEDLADEHFIQAAMQCQRKRFITKIQSFNCRLSIYLARLNQRTLSYSKSKSTLAFSLKVLMHKLKNF